MAPCGLVIGRDARVVEDGCGLPIALAAGMTAGRQLPQPPTGWSYPSCQGRNPARLATTAPSSRVEASAVTQPAAAATSRPLLERRGVEGLRRKSLDQSVADSPDVERDRR